MNFARRILSDRYARVLKRGCRFKSLPAGKLHRLRLAAKRLRYVADFLLPLHGDQKSVRLFSHRLAALQKELGSYNDMAITGALFGEVGVESSQGGTAIAAIAGWQAHASIGTKARLLNTWQDFRKTKAPWLRGEA